MSRAIAALARELAAGLSRLADLADAAAAERPTWADAATVARLVGAPERAILAAARAGDVERRFVGRAYLYSVGSVEAWIARQPIETPRPQVPPRRDAADDFEAAQRPRRARAPRGRAA